jgi:hypothetical protein
MSSADVPTVVASDKLGKQLSPIAAEYVSVIPMVGSASSSEAETTSPDLGLPSEPYHDALMLQQSGRVWSIGLANTSDKPLNQRTIVGIVALVLLLIISSVLVTAFVNNTIITNNAHATATAQSNAMATAQVQATSDAATAQVQATVTAQIQATSDAATAQAQATVTAQAQATATAIAQTQATATTIAANPDPYSPAGTLAFIDQLSQPNLWPKNANPNWGGECQFVNGAYQISQSPPNKLSACDEDTQYSNFAFEVKVTINQGDCGDLGVRENSDDSNDYIFEVCQNGSYGFYKYKSLSDSTALMSGNSSAINQGTGQLNTIAVVANGSNFDLYVNGQKIGSASDSNDYSQGTVGLFADAVSNATTVTFQDARLWTI